MNISATKGIMNRSMALMKNVGIVVVVTVEAPAMKLKYNYYHYRRNNLVIKPCQMMKI